MSGRSRNNASKTQAASGGEAKSALVVSLAIYVVVVTFMAWLRLYLFREQFITLAYGLPLLLCLWHKDRRLLWSMAATFVGMASLKYFWLVPDPHPHDLPELLPWLMQMTNIVVISAVVHAVINLTERLQAKQAQLEAANETLVERQEEISRQNEELQAQSEELAQQNLELQQQSEEVAQQNEELQQQSEELEQQAEELQGQAEELQATNQELNDRESMLQTVLVSLRDATDERKVLSQVCQALVQLAGPSAVAAAVVEKVGDQLVVREHAGAERLRQKQWPFARSFASVVMTHGRTAFVDDLAARSDLLVPEPPGRQFRSVLAAPLQVHGRAAGAMEVYAFEPRQWTQHEFRIIEWAAAQCSLAIDTVRLQQELRESEHRFRTMADAIPQLAWIARADGWIEWYNQRWHEYTGTTPEQMQGWGWQRVHDPQVLPAVLEQWKRSIATGEPFEMVFPLRGANGVFRPFLTRILPLKDQQGRVLQWFGTNTDITEQKAFEAELERLVAERTARLQELVSELEHFSYTITHDMRAPLRAMKGYAEIVMELGAQSLPQEQQVFLGRIMTSAERMDALIRDALNYSRAVRQELPLEPVDAGALLRGMLDTYPELQPPRANIRIEGEIPVVMANEAGLTQCFSNLLGNAVKFVKPGGTAEIRVRAEQRDGWARIWVEDDGIGIPKSMLPRIFDMFSRGHNTYEGTGIGLALVRKVIDRMGGRVGVESEDGQGSRFWFELALRGNLPAATSEKSRPHDR